MFTQQQLSLIKKKAILNGDKTYFGNICKIHPQLSGKRVIWNGICLECSRINSRKNTAAWVKRNPELAKERNRKSREKNAEKRRIIDRQRYIDNPQKFLNNHKKWRNKKDVSQRLRDKSSEWKRNNRARATANQSKRKAAQLRATPPWVNNDDIIPFYELARKLTIETGIQYHVDHIIPLKGKNICGLHVPWNLQVIPWYENIKKSNLLILE